ncbi:VOC family protein [Ahrensia kielensis]|uniref:VOC family protein n=1 Tax=Ahrensia kielensis TaxID=76980 RepID=A0ABU9T985_9HYPH
MQITKLDHVNIRTTQLDVMVKWYSDVLGMKSGPRPDFPFPGAWIYAGENAVVHLIGVEKDAGAGSETFLKLEHFALSATGLAAFEEKLKSRGEEYRRGELPDFKIVQINVYDPDGNHIHVDFRTDEEVA